MADASVVTVKPAHSLGEQGEPSNLSDGKHTQSQKNLPEGANTMLPELDSTEGSTNVLQQLEETFAKESFLQRVRNTQMLTANWLYSKSDDKADGKGEEGGWDLVDLSSEHGDAGAPDRLPEGAMEGSPAAPNCSDSLEDEKEDKTFYEDFDADVKFESGCVMVGQADAMEAMADFVLQCVVMHPMAAELTPEKLQAVLTKTLGELKKSKVHSLWTWSKAVYRGSAWGYGVVNAYTHPWVVKAILMAIWHSMRMLFIAIPLGL